MTMRGLLCRECQERYEHAPISVCELCFGPLEIDYDYDAVGAALARDDLAGRQFNMWRYRELLPLAGDVTVGAQVGGTPLIRAHRLGERLGIDELWIKNDSVCFPTLSFKDRVVSVALSRALEFGFDTVACASTGNLANAVAAHAATAGLPAKIANVVAVLSSDPSRAARTSVPGDGVSNSVLKSCGSRAT